MKKAIFEVLSYIKKYPILILILMAGWIINLSFFFPIEKNIGRDVYWHLSLVEVAFKTFPFQMPIFSGTKLQGYNYLIDFFMFLITKVGIPSLYVYSIIMPLIYVTSLSFLVVFFGLRYNKSIYYIAPLTFFIFLATPFSYLLSFYKRGSLFFGFNYPTAMQSPSALTNISYAYTVLLIFITFLILIQKNRRFSDSIFLGLIVGLAFGLKFYGGIMLLLLIITYEFLKGISERSIKRSFITFLSCLFFTIISLVIFYDPFSSIKTGAIFAIAPFAIANNLIEDPDGLYIPQLVMPRYYLLSLNKISFRLILIEGVTLIIYLIYNLGTRIIGLFYIIKQFIQKKITVLELSLIITIIASIILTTSLVQKGGDWWNTVQFFGYGLLLANFFAASFLYKLSFYNKKIFILFVSLIVLLTMPLNIELIIKALQKPNQNNISIDEIKALRFLKTQNNNGAIFALPIFSQLAYLPAFSTKPVFYADEGLLSNLGVNYEKRKKILQDLKNINFNNLSIRYFYLLKEDKNYEIIIKKIYQLKKIKIIYNNPKVIIYEKL